MPLKSFSDKIRTLHFGAALPALVSALLLAALAAGDSRAQTQVPGAPALAAEAGERQATLTWTPPPGEITGYDYSQDGGLSWTGIPGSGPETRTHEVTGLAGGKRYTFQVRAKNGAGPGPPSNAAGAAVRAPAVPVPEAPTNLEAAAGDRQAALAWTPPPGKVTGYDYSQDGGLSWTGIPGSGPETRTHKVTGLENGTLYGFRVRAKNSSGAGAHSEAVGARPEADSGPANSGPVVTKQTKNREVGIGGTASLDVSGAFRDPDGDPLSYTAVSSNENVATVSVSGSTVTIAGIAEGAAAVTVTASDGRGGKVSDTFTARTKNLAPVVTRPTVNREVGIGGTADLDVSGTFRDPDGDPLSYTAVSSNENVATVSVSGSTVTIAGIAEGAAAVTVTASDGRGGTASDTFTARAKNLAPVVTRSIDNQTVTAGGTASLDVSGAFRDPDGDPLSYTAVSSNESRATVSVSGSTVTIAGLAEGEAAIAVTASDGRGGRVSEAFTITVR